MEGCGEERTSEDEIPDFLEVVESNKRAKKLGYGWRGGCC